MRPEKKRQGREGFKYTAPMDANIIMLLMEGKRAGAFTWKWAAQRFNKKFFARISQTAVKDTTTTFLGVLQHQTQHGSLPLSRSPDALRKSQPASASSDLILAWAMVVTAGMWWRLVGTGAAPPGPRIGIKFRSCTFIPV